MFRSLANASVIDLAARYELEREREAATTDAEVEAREERVSLIFGLLMDAHVADLAAVAVKGNALVREYGDRDTDLIPGHLVARVMKDLAAVT